MTTTLYRNMLEIYNRTADRVKLDPGVRKILAQTKNDITVHFPVKLDNGDVRTFTGFRVQHNDVLGPFRGGVRYHPTLSLEEMKALAMWTTWQCALADIPSGGAMGGVRCNPAEFSCDELERITRRFTFALASNIGPEYDILSPDISTNSQVMAWMVDSFLAGMPPQNRQALNHVATGKPFYLGGSVGNDRGTAIGVVRLVERWAEKEKLPLAKLRYSLQGFGKVGAWTARLLAQKGATLIAVQDSSGAIANPAGISPDDLVAYVGNRGKISGYPQAEPESHGEFLAEFVDVFVAAALQNQINAQTAPQLKARLVAEAAKWPTDETGDVILRQRGIAVIPDLLCNVGGLLMSYYEWLQNKRSERWDLAEVQAKLVRKVDLVHDAVLKASADWGTDSRTAALGLALHRMESAYRNRGIFP